MNISDSPTGEGKAWNQGLASLAMLSLLAGAATGLVGAVFRLALEHGDSYRNSLIAWAHAKPNTGFPLLMIVCVSAPAVAAWLVRRFSPHASGSGIPNVEAALSGEVPPAPFVADVIFRQQPRFVSVKFVGGLLAISSGLALGREGPSVQMGASVASVLGRIFRRNVADCRVLLAGGAGAGLAVAFNAPIAGAVFVLEELVRRFDTRIAIATFGASAGAIGIGRLFLGDAPDFHVAAQPYPGFGTVPIHLALGTLCGLLGIIYNRAILGALAAANRWPKCPVEVRAGSIGAIVALIAWIAPGLVGGGDAITARTLSAPDALASTAIVFLVRFALGPLSYAARTPGGLFAPLLVLGAQSGVLLGHVSSAVLLSSDPVAMAIVGMAAFFTAVVRSPLTGIILVIEMTGSFTLLLPMLSACFAAMVVTTLLRAAPIYDSLRQQVK